MKIKRLEVPPIGTNCYILMDEATKKGAIVDPGGGAAQILKAVAEMGAQINTIFLTHSHYDHTGAVDAIRSSIPEVTVYMHQSDAMTMGGDVSPAIAGLTYYGEGDTLAVGDLTIAVMHTPGHTVGGVCLLVEDVIFTGDSIFQGTMGRCDLPGGSYSQLIASLKRLGNLEGDYRLMPGHMEETTMVRERSYNPYMLEAMG